MVFFTKHSWSWCDKGEPKQGWKSLKRSVELMGTADRGSYFRHDTQRKWASVGEKLGWNPVQLEDLWRHHLVAIRGRVFFFFLPWWRCSCPFTASNVSAMILYCPDFWTSVNFCPCSNTTAVYGIFVYYRGNNNVRMWMSFFSRVKTADSEVCGLILVTMVMFLK